MWELICHYTYKAEGRPVDISRYDNAAERRGGVFLLDGVRSGSGALRFLTATSHVLVSRSTSAWDPLVVLKVEMTVRLTEPSTGAQSLIEADNSFASLSRRRRSSRISSASRSIRGAVSATLPPQVRARRARGTTLASS